MLLTDDNTQPHCSFVPVRDWSLSRPATTPETREPGKRSAQMRRLANVNTSGRSTALFTLALLVVFVDGRRVGAKMPPSNGRAVLYGRHEAAYKLTGNAEAVARFACRGAGRGSGWSMLPGRAPLSDPNASPNLNILPDVDYCLRRVSFAVERVRLRAYY